MTLVHKMDVQPFWYSDKFPGAKALCRTRYGAMSEEWRWVNCKKCKLKYTSKSRMRKL
jgi:hypothetical protein